MSDEGPLPTSTPLELAKFVFRAFDNGDGAGVAAVTHPSTLSSYQQRVLSVMGGHLSLRRRRPDLGQAPSGGVQLDVANLDLLELRDERVENIPGVASFGQLLTLDAAEFLARLIRGQWEIFDPKNGDPVSSFEVSDDVVVEGESADVPYRRVRRYSSGEIDTRQYVLSARLEGSRWLLWDMTEVIIWWSVFLPIET